MNTPGTIQYELLAALERIGPIPISALRCTTAVVRSCERAGWLVRVDGPPQWPHHICAKITDTGIRAINKLEKERA